MIDARKLIPSEQFLSDARKAFGDIVTDAWYLDRPDRPHPECMDMQDIVLRFTNGKLVKIWNSEWGGFCPYEGSFSVDSPSCSEQEET